MNPNRLLESFFQMIRVESPSWHEADMARLCACELEELGFSVRFDDSAQATGSNTGNLIAHLPGVRSDAHIAFSAHLDTVVPCAGIEPVEEDGVIRSAGDTILSADDKAGIAAIFEGVRATLEADAPHPAITVLLTTCEEQSLLGASALAPDTLEGDVPCFVLDADGHPGSIIVGAPFHYTMRTTFRGRSAHAGVEPEVGISAVQMAARAVSSMPLGRIDERTTANVGVVSGGAAVNIVPNECRIEGECRSLYEERVNAQRDAMTAACEEAAAHFGGEAHVEWTVDYPGILHAEDAPVVGRLERAARAAGLEPCCTVSGGGADANVLATKGACAVTLGIGMTNFHTKDEFITVRDLEDAALYVEAIIAEYA